MEIRKNIQSIYQKHVIKKKLDLLLIREEHKKHYVLIKDFNTFMYDHTLRRGRKLECYINDCVKINVKQRIKMPKR